MRATLLRPRPLARLRAAFPVEHTPTPATPPDADALARRRFFWGAVVPLALLAAAGAWKVCRIIPETRPVQPGVFLQWAVPGCFPEPREQARYLFTSGAAVAVCLLGAIGWWRWKPWANGGPRWGRAQTAAGLVCQIGLAAAVAYFVAHQTAPMHLYLDLPPSHYFHAIPTVTEAGTAAFVVAAAGALYLVSRGRRWEGVAAGGVAVLATAVELLPMLYRDDQPGVTSGVSTHLTFYVGEFAAVLNGHTPRVDFVPQYQHLLGFALAPVFALVGLNLTTFCAAMAGLAGACLLGVFVALRRLTGNWWAAALLYVPFLWVSDWPVLDASHMEGQRYGPFTYFAAMPLRYFGPLVVFAVVAWWAARPAPRRTAVVSLAAGLAVLNNVDFGFPAAVAAGWAVWLAAPTGERWRTVGRFVGGAAVGFAVYAGFIALRSGHLPGFARELTFQKAFAVYGFGMLTMPRWGLHWVVAATFVSAIGAAAFRPAGDGRERVERALLGFVGVWGCGVMMYYVGRSHWHVLPMIFPAWAVALAVLGWSVTRSVSREGMSALAAVPLALVCYAGVIGLAQAAQRPNPIDNVARVVAPGPGAGWSDRRPFVERVKERTGPHERIAVIYPYGHLIAREAGEKNYFPFVEPYSVFTLAQIEYALGELDRHRVKHLYGKVWPEMEPGVRARGFVKVDSLPRGRITQTHDFDHWVRANP